MLSSPLASSSLLQREVWKYFKSSSLADLLYMMIYIVSHMFSRKMAETLAETMWICQNQTLRSSSLFAKFCAHGTKGIAVIAPKILRTEVGIIWR